MRLRPPSLLLLFLIAMIGSRLLGLGPVVIAPFYAVLGLIPLVFGLTLAVLGSRQFDRVGTNINTFLDPTILVTDGLFRYSRNPMYLGFVLLIAGAAWLTATLPAILIAVLFAVITDLWYIRFEEAAMRRRFGDAYDVYARTVRRWF